MKIKRFLASLEMTPTRCHEKVGKWRRNRHFPTPLDGDTPSFRPQGEIS
jgi:hypothetical protein